MIEAIRRFKWHLAALATLAMLPLGAAICFSRGEALVGLRLALVAGPAFLGMLGFLMLCFLGAYGEPNHPAASAVNRFFLWFATALFALFWLRFLLYLYFGR